jgi:hypothetical protein
MAQLAPSPPHGPPELHHTEGAAVVTQINSGGWALGFELAGGLGCLQIWRKGGAEVAVQDI